MKAILPSRGPALIALALLFLLGASRSAMACAVCYGDTSGSKQGEAAAWGIFAMVIIMFAMLGTLTACGFYLNYRAKHPFPDYDELLNAEETQPNPGTSS
jgi:hypothetical protein